MITPNERLTVEAVRRARELVLEIVDDEGQKARVRVADRRFAHEVAVALQSYLGRPSRTTHPGNREIR